MQDWLKVMLNLCAFGTLREIRPSEPFVTPFLQGKWKNLTDEQLLNDVYPIGTYSYLGLLAFVFLVTDFLRFKPIIILSGLSGIAVYAILLWTTSLQWVQASQFFYGLYLATEIAYYTYIYAKVEASKYPIVSSYTRIAALSGRFVSGVIAQLLTFTGLMDYRELNYITFTAQILATLCAFTLPSMSYGIYFHRRDSPLSSPIDKQPTIELEKQSFVSSSVEAFSLIGGHARAAYCRPRVVAWSALYAVSLALFVQAQTYMQLLWDHAQATSDEPVAYNGIVEALQTLLGAGGAYLAAVWPRSALPAPVAAVQGLAVFAAARVPNIYVAYAGYIVMAMLFHFTITLASAKIASQLSDESCFGLIFGVNTLVGTALQSLFTLVMIQTLHLPIQSQFYSISGLYMLLAPGWALGWLINQCRQKHSADLHTRHASATKGKRGEVGSGYSAGPHMVNPCCTPQRTAAVCSTG